MRSAYGLDTPRVVDWRERAACRDHDPEWWSLMGPRVLSSANARAMRVCADCPVLADCAEWADARAFDHVIVAGVARFEMVPHDGLRRWTS